MISRLQSAASALKESVPTLEQEHGCNVDYAVDGGTACVQNLQELRLKNATLFVLFVASRVYFNLYIICSDTVKPVCELPVFTLIVLCMPHVYLHIPICLAPKIA